MPGMCSSCPHSQRIPPVPWPACICSLMLVAAPAFVLLGAIAVSTTLYTYTAHLWEVEPVEGDAAASTAAAAAAGPTPVKKSKSK